MHQSNTTLDDNNAICLLSEEKSEAECGILYFNRVTIKSMLGFKLNTCLCRSQTEQKMSHLCLKQWT